MHFIYFLYIIILFIIVSSGKDKSFKQKRSFIKINTINVIVNSKFEFIKFANINSNNHCHNSTNKINLNKSNSW